MALLWWAVFAFFLCSFIVTVIGFITENDGFIGCGLIFMLASGSTGVIFICGGSI